MFIANAGTMASPAALTADGSEVQFDVDYLGHAGILHLLRPIMLRTANLPAGDDVRVAMPSSFGHTMHPPGGIELISSACLALALNGSATVSTS